MTDDRRLEILYRIKIQERFTFLDRDEFFLLED